MENLCFAWVKIILTADSLMQSDLIFFWDQKWVFKQKRDVLFSFVGIYCCVYQTLWILQECSSSSVATMVHRAKLAAIIKNTDLPLAAKKRQTEVINKLSFQIIGAWELIANWYLRDILCKLNENELVNHENHN